MSVSLAVAERIAEELRRDLQPYCERIEVAGSVRRRKSFVKDIELVAVSKMREELADPLQPSLFGDARTLPVSLLDETIEAWLQSGRVRPRYGKDGKQALGPAYKRLTLDSGVALDLFSVVAGAQWGLIYMIRTGSGVGPSGEPRDGFAPAMLARWKQVSSGGESRGGCLHRGSGARVLTPEEDDVFVACQAVWVPPEERTSSAAVHAAVEEARTC